MVALTFRLPCQLNVSICKGPNHEQKHTNYRNVGLRLVSMAYSKHYRASIPLHDITGSCVQLSGGRRLYGNRLKFIPLCSARAPRTDWSLPTRASLRKALEKISFIQKSNHYGSCKYVTLAACGFKALYKDFCWVSPNKMTTWSSWSINDRQEYRLIGAKSPDLL